MNKYIAYNAVLTLFLLIVLISPLAAAENNAELVERIRPAVVAVIAYNENGEVIEYGNGFFMSSEGRLLSSRHLLRHAAGADVQTREGETYPIKTVVSEDWGADLIELSIDLADRQVPYLRMTDVTATKGELMVAIGHQHIVQGFVSYVRTHSEPKGSFQLSSGALTQATGGPVVNKKGEVIGIATEQTVEDQTLTLVIATSRVFAMASQQPLTIKEWNKAAIED